MLFMFFKYNVSLIKWKCFFYQLDSIGIFFMKAKPGLHEFLFYGNAI